MRITVHAKPGARHELTEERGGEFVVAVREKPTDGEANRAVERAIAEYFDVPVSRVRIVSGRTSRRKVVEIA